MNHRTRLIALYAATVVGAIVLYTIAYDLGMSVFEGRPRGPVHSLEIVLQTLTTTGYGEDAPWTSLQMKVLVIFIQLTAILLIFAALPVFVIPLFEDVFTRSPPTSVSEGGDHIIVCGTGERPEALLDELTARELDHVLVIQDREAAVEYDDQGYTVVHGDYDQEATLEKAELPSARAIVADGGNELNLSIIIAAQSVASHVPVYSIVDDPSYSEYHRHAGAIEVFSPRTLLGEGLASKVTRTVSVEVEGIGGTEHLDADRSSLQIVELPIRPDSEYVGELIDTADINRMTRLPMSAGDETATTLIGVWSRGEFLTPPFAELRLDEHTTLLVVGRPQQIQRLKRELQAEARPLGGHGPVVVLGHGVVGSTVAQALAETYTPTTVVDINEEPGVDVVGDASDKEVLAEAGVVPDSDVRVVIALDDDITALVATFVIRDISPDIQIIARANKAESVTKLYHAGANHVLSLAAVSGQLLASSIVEKREAITYDNQVRLVGKTGEHLEGHRLGDLPLNGETGCSLIGLQSEGGQLNTSPDLEHVLGPTDGIVIAGTDRHLDQFDELLADREPSVAADPPENGSTPW